MPLRELSRRWIQWQYGYAARYLTKTPPEKLAAAGEKKLIKTFRRAAGSMPAYQELLSRRGIRASEIQTLADFRGKVPIVNKRKLFHDYSLSSLCAHGTLDDIRSFFSSSGSSGLFSFGVESWKAARTASFGIEFLLDHYFDIFKKKTLLVNCLPMGVTVPTRILQVADASVRADVILAILRKLCEDFDQFILIGESPFLKKVVDTGTDEGISWKELCVHLITGGEFIPENYRTYMGNQLGIDFDNPETGMIAVNMGLSELSLSLFRESRQIIRLRREIFKNDSLRRAFALDRECYCPLIMQYFPPQIFVETEPDATGRPQLVVSLLDREMKLPLIRYNTEDTGRLISVDHMLALLKKHGLTHLAPEFRLPFVLVSGKHQPVGLPGGRTVSPNLVKEALYHDIETARSLTGNFHLKQETSGNPVLLVQLRKGYRPSTGIQEALAHAVPIYCNTELEIRLLPYHEFPFGMELSYDKKFKYA